MAFGLRPQSMRRVRQQLEESQNKRQFVQNDGLFKGIKEPEFQPINAAELEASQPTVLIQLSRKLNILQSNITDIKNCTDAIAATQAQNMKIEQQIENIFYQYIDKNINPAMLKIDQKIAQLLNIMEHPKGSELSTIDQAETLLEIEQQVYSDSMALLEDDVKDIKQMLAQIQQKIQQQ